VNLILLIFGKEFLIHILGRGTDRWLPALPALQILCGYGIFRALLEPVANVILGIGKPQLFLKAILTVAIIELGLIYPAVRFYNIEGVAVAVTIAYVSQYAIYLPVMRKEIDVKVGELFREVRMAFWAVLIMSAVLLGLKGNFGFSLSAMVIQCLIGILVYLFAFGVIDRWRLFGEFRTILR
jgi:O-antigen/teichoic acid export membrane protein